MTLMTLFAGFVIAGVIVWWFERDSNPVTIQPEREAHYSSLTEELDSSLPVTPMTVSPETEREIGNLLDQVIDWAEKRQTSGAIHISQSALKAAALRDVVQMRQIAGAIAR